MDHDSEIAKAKWLLAAGLVFLISAFFAYDEARYAVWGKTTDARLVDAREVTHHNRRGGDTHGLVVEYSFADGSETRNESDEVAVDWPLERKGTVPVQYVAGEKLSSRLAGHKAVVPVAVFFICLAVMGFFLFKLVREANEPVRPRRRNAGVR